MSREVLEPLCGRYPSAEEVSRRLAETAGVPGPDGDWVWLCVTVLWERWFPEIPNLEMIDDKAQLGYANLAEGKTERACDVWAEYWRDVQWLMKKWDIATIAGFDKLFGQTEYLYNWCNDYVMELANAGIRKPLYNRRRLEFCRELMPLADANDTLFMENLRRFSAESLATTGDLAGAERLYQEWLDADPKWGWGWIGWSDLYDLFAPDAPSYERAEEPLLRGLGVRGLRGRTEISDRLADLRRRREDAGVKRGAAADERGDRSVARPYDGPPAAGKVGRNDPCPCGSGRKYKRCCGR